MLRHGRSWPNYALTISGNAVRQNQDWGSGMRVEDLFDGVIQKALKVAQAQSVPIFTFAFYFDHESSAVSVCIDTEDNSHRVVQRTNAYNSKHFHTSIAAGDLRHAAMWQANVGRNLSLGDFALVNLARTDVQLPVDADFFLGMVRAVVRNQAAIEQQSADPVRLCLCSSGANDEVALVWSAMPGQS
jgi:hypothetical protein